MPLRYYLTFIDEITPETDACSRARSLPAVLRLRPGGFEHEENCEEEQLLQIVATLSERAQNLQPGSSRPLRAFAHREIAPFATSPTTEGRI
ncbi:unnamed protein product [Effrenium voratum]|nr:unnamed protein product [Effrenium voratum]